MYLTRKPREKFLWNELSGDICRGIATINMLFKYTQIASARLRYVTININNRHAVAITAGNKTVVSE